MGSSGMLGLGVSQAFRGAEFEVLHTTRKMAPISNGDVFFEATHTELTELSKRLQPGDTIINCIGVIKPYIQDADSLEVRRAIQLNSMFPIDLATIAVENGLNVIQIATDCVFSGARGSYTEADIFDPEDVYGKTKSLGEVTSSNVMNLRVSIIGPESGRRTSLLEWVRGQSEGASINGYTDHLWNGIPTYHFGKLTRAIVEKGLFKAGTWHILPNDVVSKFELVTHLARKFEREDINISKSESGLPVNRTLATLYPGLNASLWAAAGYDKPPGIGELILEMPSRPQL